MRNITGDCLIEITLHRLCQQCLKRNADREDIAEARYVISARGVRFSPIADIPYHFLINDAFRLIVIMVQWLLMGRIADWQVAPEADQPQLGR